MSLLLALVSAPANALRGGTEFVGKAIRTVSIKTWLDRLREKAIDRPAVSQKLKNREKAKRIEKSAAKWIQDEIVHENLISTDKLESYYSNWSKAFQSDQDDSSFQLFLYRVQLELMRIEREKQDEEEAIILLLA